MFQICTFFSYKIAENCAYLSKSKKFLKDPYSHMSSAKRSLGMDLFKKKHTQFSKRYHRWNVYLNHKSFKLV
jgi:hypothetical protein